MNRVSSKSAMHATAAIAALLALGACTKPEAQTTDTASKAAAAASTPASAATPNMVSFTAKEFSFEGPDTIPAGLGEDTVRAMVAKQAAKRVGLHFVERERATWDHGKLGGVY